MTALYLLAAHLVGDFLLQTRWQAMGKFGWTEEAIWLRTKHVAVYCACFLPVVVTSPDVEGGDYAFLVGVFALHWLTDAQRFPNNLAETIAWRFISQENKLEEWQIYHALNQGVIVYPHQRKRLPPNPWPPMSLAIDQTLHILQIAVLAALFL